MAYHREQSWDHIHLFNRLNVASRHYCTLTLALSEFSLKHTVKKNKKKLLMAGCRKQFSGIKSFPVLQFKRSKSQTILSGSNKSL